MRTSLPTITNLELLTLRHQEDGTATVRLSPRRPIRFLAGQHGLLLIPGGGARPLSIASAPEDPVLTFGTSLDSGSRFKRALAGLRPGARARLLGPLGGFTLTDTEPSVVMLAQGIGVTPFRSMLQHIEAAGTGTHTTLVHVGTSHPFHRDTHAAATQTQYPDGREDFRGLVVAAAQQQPDAMFLVSGSVAFVRETDASLREASVPSLRIRRDTFYGYRPINHHTAADQADGPRASIVG